MKKNLVLHNINSQLRIATSIFALVFSLDSLAAVDLKDAKRAIRVRQYDVAFHLYQQAAIEGNAEAQYQLANLYTSGNGVSTDEKKALEWLEKSAAQQHPAAQYSLAIKLFDQNYSRALDLMSQSADRSYSPAKKHLERMNSVAKTKWKDKSSQDKMWFGSARNGRLDDMRRINAINNKVDRQDDAGRTALFAAIESNRVETVQWLLSNGANPNHRDKFGNSAAFITISENRIDLLRLLLKNGADKKQTLANGDNLLHYSIRRERYAFVPLLLQKNVPVNHINKDGWTPLDLANYAKAKKIVAKLTSKGAKKGNGWNNIAKNKNDDVPASGFSSAGTSEVNLANLAQIVISGNAVLLKQIVEQQEKKQEQKINQKLEDGSTLMSLAVKEGNAEMVEALLLAGSYPSVPTYSGIRPLHMAARAGNLAIIELLIQAGAEPLTRDDQNRDAIQWAIQARQQAASSLLLNRLFELKKYHKEKGPLDNYILMAAQYKLDPLIVKLGPHATKAAVDNVGRNALWFAAQNKNPAIIPLLISYGIPADTADHEGKTPFYIAVSNDCLACAEQLIRYSDINRKTATGNSSLIAAAENGNSLLVSWLLKHGADTELTNELRNTALISAVESNATDVVYQLIEAGANISRKNNLGFSALDIAKKSNKDIHTYLKSRSLLGAF